MAAREPGMGTQPGPLPWHPARQRGTSRIPHPSKPNRSLGNGAESPVPPSSDPSSATNSPEPHFPPARSQLSVCFPLPGTASEVFWLGRSRGRGALVVLIPVQKEA